MLDQDTVLAEIDDVFARCGTTSKDPRVPSRPPPPNVIGDSRVVGNAAAMVSSILAAIERNAPHSVYVEQARKYAERAATATPVNNMLGVLLSVRQDIEAGYVRGLEDRVRDELSGDLLETADSIVRLNAAPAIVLAVSVLEEHVRKMADARGIGTIKADGKHRSFEDMVADLQREGAIASTEKRTASAWYAQRTSAAHGRFEEVVKDEVPRVIGGVRDFIVRHPR